MKTPPLTRLECARAALAAIRAERDRTAPRDLSADIIETTDRYHRSFIAGTSEREYLADELTRLGWQHRDAVAVPNDPQWLEGVRCPRCNCTLLHDGAAIWCSFIGGQNEKPCTYGIDAPRKMVPQPETPPITTDNKETP